jgi:AcrR family transcriptional regulator
MPSKTTLRDMPASTSEIRGGDGTADRLAEAALRLFDQKGFDATTIDDIAAAANVSRRTFFRHFPRKESVILFEQAFIQAELRRRLAEPPAGVSVLDEFLATVPWILRQASLDPARLKLRIQLVKAVPELASTERDADSATIGKFAAAYAGELGGGAENRVRAMAVGAAIVAAANAALDESLGGDDPVPLFEAAASSIRGWAPARPTRPLVAVVQVPETMTDAAAAALIQQALATARGQDPTSAKGRSQPERG